ncbi:hypothetical protein GGH92_006052, partial [Coemansia sp. RSA 2673]
AGPGSDSDALKVVFQAVRRACLVFPSGNWQVSGRKEDSGRCVSSGNGLFCPAPGDDPFDLEQ